MITNVKIGICVHVHLVILKLIHASTNAAGYSY